MARKRLDQRAHVARQFRAGAERGLFEEAVGDLADRAAADGVDAGDRQQVGDQRARALRIGAGERRQHALIFRPLIGAAEHQAVEVLRQIGLAVEILDQPPLPRRRQIEPGDQAGKQRDVADPDVGLRQSVMRGRLQPERQHLGVGRRLVGTSEGFDAGLQEFGRLIAAVAEYRPEIAEAGRPAGERGGEIVARNRDGEVRPQAEFAAAGRRGQIHALADVLAGEVEERLGRLQDGGRDARVARALVGGEQRLRARFGPFRLTGHARVHRLPHHQRVSGWRPFSTIVLRIRRRLPAALNAGLRPNTCCR